MKKTVLIILTICFCQLSFSQINTNTLDNVFNNSKDLNGSPSGGRDLFAGKGGAIARYKNDRVLVAGHEGQLLKVMRIYSDGRFDSTFHDGSTTTKGVGQYDLGESVYVTAIAVDEGNDLIYISGYTRDKLRNDAGFVFSLKANGTPNSNFNGNGLVAFDPSITTGEHFNDIGVQTLGTNKGKIIVAGNSLTGNLSRHIIMRLKPDGKQDEFFNQNNIYFDDIPFGQFNKMDLNAADQIVLASIGTIVKLNPNGVLDPSFNPSQSKGILDVLTGANLESLMDVSFYEGTKIVALIHLDNSYKVIRLLSDGNYDKSFNGAGSFTYDSGNQEFPLSIAVDRFKNIIVSGLHWWDGNMYLYSVLKLFSDGRWAGNYEVSSGPWTVEFPGGIIISPDERLMVVGTSPHTNFITVTKIHLKELHDSTFVDPDSLVKYEGGDPFLLPLYFYSPEDYKPIYQSSDPSVVSVTGRTASIRNAGTAYIKAFISQDSAYYGFLDSIKVNVKANAPALITGNRFITEGKPDTKVFEILPKDLYGYWTFEEFEKDERFPNVIEIRHSDTLASYYFTGDFKGGLLTYTYYHPVTEDRITIERNIYVVPDKVTGSGELDKLVCPQELASCSGNYIDHFRLHSLSNDSSGCGMGGYSDFTDNGKTTSLLLGSVYSANAKIKSNLNVSRYVGLWLDYNNDGDFTGADEFLGVSFTNDTEVNITNIVLKNNDSYAGPRRLRVRVRPNTPFHSTEACQTEGEPGETEDYLVTLKEQEALQAPHMITPNNDGKNDFFVVRGIDPKQSNKLTIFDRMGDVKYAEVNYQNNWDGKNEDGERLSKGTYFYTFTNGSNTIKGFFEILY